MPTVPLAAVQTPDAALATARFPAPDGLTFVRFDTSDLTSVCPLTGQPDFYDLATGYRPVKWCLETRSVKTYLTGFRELAYTAEELAVIVRDAFVAAVDPICLTVQLRQHARGGIVITARADHNGGVTL